MSRTSGGPVDRQWIEAHVPHAGRMCLLDGVSRWDPRSILCHASSHRRADHPLRSHGRLGPGCLVEYAAQALAVHAALLQGPHAVPHAPRPGMLASARSLELLVTDVAGILEDLSIYAQRAHGDARGALYEFSVDAGTRVLARGRLGVVLEAPPPAGTGASA